MNDELLKRLDALAAKLGTTADQLWAIMLRQSRVEAWTDSIMGVLCFGFVAAYCWFLMKKGKQILTDESPYTPTAIFAGLVAVILLICGIFAVTYLPTEILNPGYFAFDRLLSKLKQ